MESDGCNVQETLGAVLCSAVAAGHPLGGEGQQAGERGTPRLSWCCWMRGFRGVWRPVTGGRQ